MVQVQFWQHQINCESKRAVKIPSINTRNGTHTKGPSLNIAVPLFKDPDPLSKNIAFPIIVIKRSAMQHESRCFRVKLLLVGR